jgi:hypothetical protein
MVFCREAVDSTHFREMDAVSFGGDNGSALLTLPVWPLMTPHGVEPHASITFKLTHMKEKMDAALVYDRTTREIQRRKK